MASRLSRLKPDVLQEPETFHIDFIGLDEMRKIRDGDSTGTQDSAASPQSAAEKRRCGQGLGSSCFLFEMKPHLRCLQLCARMDAGERWVPRRIGNSAGTFLFMVSRCRGLDKIIRPDTKRFLDRIEEGNARAFTSA